MPLVSLPAGVDWGAMLAAEVKHGAVFHMEGGDHPVSVESLFGAIE